MELFAKRGLVPNRLHATEIPRNSLRGAPELHVDLQISGLESIVRDIIAASLRQIIGVRSVLVASKE